MRSRYRLYLFVRRRIGRGRSSLALVTVLACGALAGCASSDGMTAFIVDPGHYSVYHCKDFKAQLAYLISRQQQLRELMDKAGESSGGALIGNLTYRANYEDVLGEEKVLRRSAAEKNCELPPPAASASAAAPASAPPNVPPAASVPATTPTSYQSDQTIR
jgi:hypothetical protein